MFKLQQKNVITTTQVVVKRTNYSDEQINELFELRYFKFFQRAFSYEEKAKRLFNLGLSFNDSKYLLHTKKLSVDEVEKCYEHLGVGFVELIKENYWTKDILLNEIPRVILLVGGVSRFKELISAKKLSLNEIKTLFGQLRLQYSNVISLIDCGYTVNQINTLLEAKIACSTLIELAREIDASEVYSLYNDDRQNIVFLSTVKSVLQTTITDVDSACYCFQTIYNNVPDNLCKSILNSLSAIPPVEKTIDDAITYEEILIHYMDLAGGKILDHIGNSDIAVHISFKALEKIKSVSNFYCEIFPVKPFLLASIWSALQVSLEDQYLKNIEKTTIKDIVKSAISFLVSSMCGATGYFHSGGVGLPSLNMTSYIKTYFNIQYLIKNNAPKLYGKIPACLLFDSNESFDDMIKEKQISAAQGLAMVYTFRVGNAFLCNLLKKPIFSFESANNVFRSLWPLPQRNESIRMYFIYSGIPIYTNFNLKDVFVQIN